MNFTCVSRDSAGRQHRGTVVADTRAEAVRYLYAQGRVATRLTPESPLTRLRQWWLRRRRAQPVMMLFRQLSVMIGAGGTVSESLRLLAAQESPLRELIADLCQQTSSGQSLCHALQLHPDTATATVCAMVRAGEAAGSLDLMLDRIASYLEQQYKTRNQRVTAMIYPAFLLTVLSLMALFLLTFVLPSFVAMLTSLQRELPLPTRILLGVHGFVRDCFPLLVVLVLALPLLTLCAYGREGVRRRVDRALLQLPLLGRLNLHNEAVQFLDTFTLLHVSGVLPEVALGILAQTTDNLWVRESLLRNRLTVSGGKPLSQAMREEHLFPATMIALMATGEAVGNLDALLPKIADFYRFESQSATERLQALMEPCAILLIGALVGFIVFAILLPILDTITAGGQF